MKKLFFLVTFFLIGSHSIQAQEAIGIGNDQVFMKELARVKNPFEDGIPKPIIIPRLIHQAHRSVISSKLKSPTVVITLPALDLQGVIVGEEIHQAIINDQVVPLHGVINGVRLTSVTKKGVGLLYKGKKFFLKVD